MTGEHTDATVEEGSDPGGLPPETAAEEADATDLTPEIDPLVQLAAERDEYLADLQRLSAAV